MRNAKSRTTNPKAGDYTLPPTIEEEMEKDKRRPNRRFHQDQMEYEIGRQIRLYNQMEEEEYYESELRERAPISKGSQKILAGKRRGPIHERLFAMSHQKKVKEAANVLSDSQLDKYGLQSAPEADENKPSITPKSKNLRRPGKIEDRLNEDA